MIFLAQDLLQLQYRVFLTAFSFHAVFASTILPSVTFPVYPTRAVAAIPTTPSPRIQHALVLVLVINIAFLMHHSFLSTTLFSQTRAPPRVRAALIILELS